MGNDGNRGRSEEARDPNRAIDPETGEKEGLGPRDANPGGEQVDVNENAGDEAGDGSTEQA